MDINERNRKNVTALRIKLVHLPNSLPEPPVPRPDLRHFAPRPGVLPGDKAVHEALEEVLGPLGFSNFSISERGAGIVALADVLERYLAQHPTSLLLQRWLYVALIAADNAYRLADVTPPAGSALQVSETMESAPRSQHASLQPSQSTSSANLSSASSPPTTSGLTNQTKMLSDPPGPPEKPSGLATGSTSHSIRPEPPSEPSPATPRRTSMETFTRVKRKRHPAYSLYTVTQDGNLRQLVQALSTSKSCLRSRSYAIRKLPWHSAFMSEDTLLEAALQGVLSTTHTVPVAVTEATSSSSGTPSMVQALTYALILGLARKLDAWERDDIYHTVEKACIEFRRMGIESESSVSLGAHEFLEIGHVKVEDYQWLIVLRVLDVFANACGSRVEPRSFSSGNTIARMDGSLLSSLLSAPLGWSTSSADWVSVMSKLADKGAVRAPYETILSPDALAQLSTFSWGDDGPCKLPECHKVDDLLPNLLKGVTESLSSVHFRADFIAVHHNLRTATAALGFILHKCGSNARSDSDQICDLAKLKDFIIAAKRTDGSTITMERCTIKDCMAPLTVALFVSPVFLFNKVMLFRNSQSASELLETWKLLGNVGRPAALTRLERDIWRLLIRVLDGADLTACLLSFLAHWRTIASDYNFKFADAKTWFKPGPLPTGMPTISRQSSAVTASEVNGSIPSAYLANVNEALGGRSNDEVLQTDNVQSSAANDHAGPSSIFEGHGVQGIKRRADFDAGAAESSKRPRLSVPTNPQNELLNAGSVASPLTGHTSPTPSQDGDAFQFGLDSPSIFAPNRTPSLPPPVSMQVGSSSSIQPSVAPTSESLLATVLAEIKQLRAERDASRAEVGTLQAERDSLKTAQSDSNSRLLEALNRAQQAEGRVQQLDAELGYVRSHAESTHAKLESALAQSCNRADSADARAKQLGEERDDLLVRLRASEQAVSEHADETAALQSEWQRVDSERLSLVEDLHKQVQTLKTGVAACTGQMQAAQAEKEKAVAEKDSVLQTVRKLLPGIDKENPQDILQALEAELERLRYQASTTDQRVLAADQRAANADQRVSEADQRAATAEQDRARMEDAHDRRAAHISLLQRKIAELESNSWKF